MEVVIQEVYQDTNNKQLAQKTALDTISKQLVIEALGESKYQQEQQKIKNDILKNKNRYILSVSSTSPVFKEDSKAFFSQVTVKVSKSNLKQLLLEHNLFYRDKSSFCVLPVLSLSFDMFGEKSQYHWWLKKQSLTNQDLKPLANLFFDLLTEELIKKGFYVLNPVFQKILKGSPLGVLPKKQNPSAKSFSSLAKFYACDIILLGSVDFGPLLSQDMVGLFFKKTNKNTEFWAQFTFKVYNIQTKEFLLSLKKKFPFLVSSKELKKDLLLFLKKQLLLNSKEVLGSLSYQLASYQQQGSLDLNRLKISIQGPLNYIEKDQLKTALLNKISSLSKMEVSLLTSSRVVYLAESSKTASQIAQHIKKTSFPGFVVQVKGSKKKELEIYAKKR